MLQTITGPEVFERDGKQFTRQKLMSGTTTINLIRPVLTPEEYEKRRLAIEQAAIDLVKSTMANKKTCHMNDSLQQVHG